jgi:hypothetical protein
MTTDEQMKIDYAVVLKQLQDELDGMDERRQALLASIAAIRRLVSDDQTEQAFPPMPDAPVRMPAIPPQFFAGMTPTAAYRELMQRWPGHYKPPQIADLFMAGGMDAPNRTQLVQSIHSVLKRERQRQAAEERRRAENVIPIARTR